MKNLMLSIFTLFAFTFGFANYKFVEEEKLCLGAWQLCCDDPVTIYGSCFGGIYIDNFFIHLEGFRPTPNYSWIKFEIDADPGIKWRKGTGEYHTGTLGPRFSPDCLIMDPFTFLMQFEVTQSGSATISVHSTSGGDIWGTVDSFTWNFSPTPAC